MDFSLCQYIFFPPYLVLFPLSVSVALHRLMGKNPLIFLPLFNRLGTSLPFSRGSPKGRLYLNCFPACVCQLLYSSGTSCQQAEHWIKAVSPLSSLAPSNVN